MSYLGSDCIEVLKYPVIHKAGVLNVCAYSEVYHEILVELFACKIKIYSVS